MKRFVRSSKSTIGAFFRSGCLPDFNWRIAFACFSMICANFPMNMVAGEETTKLGRSLPSVDPGTRVVDEKSTDWNRVLLVATPQFSSGDISSLAENIRDTVASFQLVLMAKTQRVRGVTPATDRYQLAKIGVSYAAKIGDELVVVDTDSAKKLGLTLSFVANQILGENYKQLASLRLVAQSSTLAVFDAPTIMFHQQQHRDFVTRHFVWVEPSTGNVSMLVWLLDAPSSGKRTVAAEPLRWVATPTYEVRKIHVDGSNFFLGIPAKRAFAVEELPPGKNVAWNAALRELAAREAYDNAEMARLCELFNEALAPLRPRPAGK